MQKLLDIQPAIKEPAKPYIPKKYKGTVEFQDVHFSYPGQDEVVRGIDFSVSPGEKLAIVGPSGAGKSTITKLLTRFYDVANGQILIDGTTREIFAQEETLKASFLRPPHFVQFSNQLGKTFLTPDEMISCIERK